jgi:D-alanyl-D-alanine carboxypeptidase/D-alanyl-D-alanine-endopeptidase (penicillin-binding protein 4)
MHLFSTALLISLLFFSKGYTRDFASDVKHPLFLSSQWGLHVIDVDSKEVVFTHNASKLFIPASITKMFTTMAALDTLGPSYIFKTTVKASLPDQAGQINGNIYLVGGGDSSLQYKNLRQLAKKIYNLGVRIIHGKVITNKFCEGSFLPKHAEWEDLSMRYAPEISMLSVNDNVVKLTIFPNSTGSGLAHIEIDQEIPYCQLINKLETVVDTKDADIKVSRGLADNIIEITGTIPFNCYRQDLFVSIHNPHEYAGRLFLKALEDLGISVLEADCKDDTELSEIVAVSSAPLSTIIDKINKLSHNLSANLLFQYLIDNTSKKKLPDLPLENPVTNLMAQLSIQPSEYALYEGSGLSRSNLITPLHVIKLLEYVESSPFKEHFLNSLPQAGVDGTLAARFELLPSDITIKAKTGGLRGVSNLAGFINFPNGQRFIFAFFINHSLWAHKETTDALDEMLLHLIEDKILEAFS